MERKEDTIIENRNEFDDMEFTEALCVYRNSNIHESLISSNLLVRMFAVLDRMLYSTLFQLKIQRLKQIKKSYYNNEID